MSTKAQASTGRIVYWIDPTQDTTRYGGYVPSVVTEFEPGHQPMIGPHDGVRPIIWGSTLEDAQANAEAANAEMGIAPDDARSIVTYSMALGQDDSHLSKLRLLRTLMGMNDISSEGQGAALEEAVEWAIEKLSSTRPSVPYTVAYDDREPESPYVAQYTTQVGRAATMRDARRLNFLHNNARTRPADEPTDPRGSELEFRKFIPRRLNGFDVLHIDGWQAGVEGDSYASALVVSHGGASGFCVQRVSWRHDSPLCTWDVDAGEYCYESLTAAREGLARRLREREMEDNA